MERVMTTVTIEELQARLDKLAVAAQDGEAGARQEYAATLDELARLRGDAELRDRAEKQRAVREDGERQARAEAHRQELEARYAKLEAQLRELAPGVDAAAGILVDRAQAFLSVAEQQYLLAQELGRGGPRLRRVDAVGNSILWRLASLPQLGERIGRPDRFYRKPLAQLVGEGGEASA